MTHTLRALTPSDAPAAAALHALAFADSWSEAAFTAQFADPAAATLGDFDGAALIAFALFREVAGDADLLTVAVHPGRRRQGHARTLLTALTQTFQVRGVLRLTLDVAEDNAPARRLYATLGFKEDGRRPRYYSAGRAVPVDAVLMSKSLKG